MVFLLLIAYRSLLTFFWQHTLCGLHLKFSQRGRSALYRGGRGATFKHNFLRENL